MPKAIEQLGRLKLVPIIVIDDPEDARPLAEALIAGGLPCAEVTFRTEAAGEALRRLAGIEGLLLGAGTVLTLDQAREAEGAGARFIVTPGFNPKIVSYCLDHGLEIFPGVCTPTDLDGARGFGLEVVKFFPAEAFGGLKTLKAIAAPFHMMKFIPTGGINAQNLADYLSFPKVVACGGSWMAPKNLIAEKNFAEVTRLTREAVALAAQS
jgi:2-dehydro-3-deoxyphosphogluconate aldolase/(4S)-4-hydroxy-2-oxoglutarate aldolase